MDALIFDVDGTLWDSRIPVAHAWNEALTRCTGRTYDFSPEYLGTLFGKSMDELLAALLPEIPDDERAALGEACYARENELLETEHGTLYEGVADTLAVLSRCLPCYIVSNCQQGYIDVMLKTTGLQPYISGFLCFGDTGTCKGETLVTLCKQYDLHSPVYVGDTQGDADACAMAGIPMIFAAYGLGSVSQPQKSIDHFAQLLAMVRESEEVQQ